ncbi:MAG: InlB B-repeat-containing protein, partial [Spirochaetales bacterium]
MKRNKAIAFGSTIVALLVALSACEDTLTPQLQQSMRLAELPHHQLTIQAPANGTATPVGDRSVPEGEPIEINVTADDGFGFRSWEQVSGDGVAAFTDADSAATEVRVTDGDATIRAVVGRTERTLSVSAGRDGTVDPEGEVSVEDGVPRNISAMPNAGYEFGNRSITGGAGSVEFGDPEDAETT